MREYEERARAGIVREPQRKATDWLCRQCGARARETRAIAKSRGWRIYAMLCPGCAEAKKKPPRRKSRGRPPTGPTERVAANIARARKLRAIGATMPEIGREIGVSKQRVHQYLSAGGGAGK